jgi:hypothetical protein
VSGLRATIKSTKRFSLPAYLLALAIQRCRSARPPYSRRSLVSLSQSPDDVRVT